jgi:hypothetical protein
VSTAVRVRADSTASSAVAAALRNGARSISGVASDVAGTGDATGGAGVPANVGGTGEATLAGGIDDAALAGGADDATTLAGGVDDATLAGGIDDATLAGGTDDEIFSDPITVAAPCATRAVAAGALGVVDGAAGCVAEGGGAEMEPRPGRMGGAVGAGRGAADIACAAGTARRRLVTRILAILARLFDCVVADASSCEAVSGA